MHGHQTHSWKCMPLLLTSLDLESCKSHPVSTWRSLSMSLTGDMSLVLGYEVAKALFHVSLDKWTARSLQSQLMLEGHDPPFVKQPEITHYLLEMQLAGFMLQPLAAKAPLCCTKGQKKRRRAPAPAEDLQRCKPGAAQTHINPKVLTRAAILASGVCLGELGEGGGHQIKSRKHQADIL